MYTPPPLTCWNVTIEKKGGSKIICSAYGVNLPAKSFQGKGQGDQAIMFACTQSLHYVLVCTPLNMHVCTLSGNIRQDK